jgi:hypothetical protein
MQPGVEPVRVTKPGQVSPGADERLLDGIARELAVAEDEAGGCVQPRKSGIDERGEGVVIASLGPLDLDSLVHGRLRRCAAMVAALSGYGVAGAPKVHLRASGARPKGAAASLR